MANALELLERAYPGRRPSLNNRGELRGFRSRPGAPQSPRDTMAGLTPQRPETGGLTPKSEWNSFFAPRTPTPSLAPESPANAAEMAAEMEESSDITEPTPTDADSYLRSAARAADRYMTRQGVVRMPFSQQAPARYGDSFRNRYGTGSVSYGGPTNTDFQRKLARLSAASDPFDEIDY